MNQKDKILLELIQKFFGIEKVNKQGENAYTFQAQSLKDLIVIIDHFDKYLLITQKHADFLLFKKGY